ncbi:glycoside hydrolase family 10 protein [Proteiniphilum propionicum]|uniref:glycoside hydrolase family 10 protein n=1 Tax=Proteiniphilum propionicum TaxID=2829812 RepID=UPI001EEC3757|nr:family 10 glycosylhydrolase [Proteiniphilum propionicum]ULB35777.1 family 10 glycosylhydrolase [Proteiniphilum propionicum]
MNQFNRLSYLLFIIVLISACGVSKKTLTHQYSNTPKREFRGAWIQTVGQSRYTHMNSAAMKHYFSEMVRKLDEAGINAVIFQIRPEADAFYKSDLEPWSRFLTGEQGKALDDPDFDPLAFITAECHKRGMELHAWLNPYRVKTNINNPLSASHIYMKYPERFIQYGNQLYFDPGLPENRSFICEVVRDIVSRYDVDAIHMDDYFYPYPIAGTPFPDEKSFNNYAASQGFSAGQLADWRRNNVNLLIRQIKYTIAGTKPWVRFGISPFGIYRNKRSDSNGSDTNGLQNYDDLYADIKLWVEKGWIDYNLPQLYWEIGHSAADYTTLLNWWNANNFQQTLYIGQDLKRSIDKNELEVKIRQSREMPFVNGNCYWYGYQILDNTGGVADMLKTDIHRARALVPASTHMHNGRPGAVKKLTNIYTEDMHFLTWEHKKTPMNPETAQKFVVYRFHHGERVDIDSAENIVTVTPDNFFLLPYEGGETRWTYVVTALDAFGNESKGQRIKIKL